jgi:hypothetical protein
VRFERRLSTRVGSHVALLTFAALAPWVPVAAQDAPLAAELSDDSVGMAEVFELRVRVDVPPGTVVYFPDTIDTAADIESFAPVEWREERATNGTTQLVLAYPVIPFGTGVVHIPELEVILAPTQPDFPGEDFEGSELRGASFVGRWEDGRRRFGAGTRRTYATGPTVWVDPVQTDAELAEGAMPKGPDDVMGFGWSWPTVVLIALFSSVIVAAGVATTRDWLGRRVAASTPAPDRLAPDAARREALAEIDRLIGAGPWAGEHERDLYTSTSAVVRRYASRLDPAWGKQLTGSELMSVFRAARPKAAGLVAEMTLAERMKFGRFRSGPAVADAHLRTLHAWLTDQDGDRDDTGGAP